MEGKNLVILNPAKPNLRSHAFNVGHKDELNTFKFIALQDCAMGYFEAQRETIMAKFEDSVVERTNGLIMKGLQKALYDSTGRDVSHLNYVDLRALAPRKILRAVTKRAEALVERDRATLTKTYEEFLAVNNRMLNHMAPLMQSAQLDPIVEDVYVFTDNLIIPK